MDYRELQVWKKAHELTLLIYRRTRAWPREELDGLTSQVRRAAISIEANLAEGQGRRGSAEFAHFVSLAMGCAAELECELTIAGDLGYWDFDTATEMGNRIAEVRRMLFGLASKLSPIAHRPSPGAADDAPRSRDLLVREGDVVSMPAADKGLAALSEEEA